jgi:predicted RNA-binding protein with PUA-like domain
VTKPPRQHWLVKSEAGDYSIDDLARDGSTPWTGVRNHEAKNLMRDRMRSGDRVLFYHSNGSPSGVAGVARVRARPSPDPTQFDPASPYFDPGASQESPRWWLVEIEFVRKLPRTVPLPELRQEPELSEMTLFRRSRLSVQPVGAAEFERILKMAGA